MATSVVQSLIVGEGIVKINSRILDSSELKKLDKLEKELIHASGSTNKGRRTFFTVGFALLPSKPIICWMLKGNYFEIRQVFLPCLQTGETAMTSFSSHAGNVWLLENKSSHIFVRALNTKKPWPGYWEVEFKERNMKRHFSHTAPASGCCLNFKVDKMNASFQTLHRCNFQPRNSL